MNIKELIKKNFSEKNFLEYIVSTFDANIEIEDTTSDIKHQYIKKYTRVAEKNITKFRKIGFFIVESSTQNIEKIRVGFNDFIGKLISSGNYAYKGLIVAIYHPKSDVWRLSYVAFELDDNRQLSTKPKRYTFELGKDIPTKTAEIQLELLSTKSTFNEIKEAFSVEKLSNEFFREYKNLYFKLIENVKPIDNDKASKQAIKDEKEISSYIKKMLGRIVFLYFVQKKGWLNGEKKFLSKLLKTCIEETPNIDFYDEVMEVLFFEALNKKRTNNLIKLGNKEYSIPYLNGGLFNPDDYDDLDISISNEYVEKIFNLFNNYNFTIIEDSPTDSEVAIDPEMLGRVFEDLLEDRKDKGAFYTPREIVHYMCEQSIQNYMQTKPKDITELKYIKNIKVLDPAIGSGAFPMGMLHEILQTRVILGDKTPLAKLKREIIQNSIYGIDIEPSAVEIAKLRFWLSIVVDEEVENIEDVEPLPNLFYKIMVGNSLVENIDNIDPLKGKTKKSLNELESLFKKYYAEHKNKSGIKNQISIKLTKLFKTLLDSYSNQLLLGGTEKELKANQKETEVAKQVTTILKELQTNHFSDKIFLYKLFFRDILEDGGFDVVIGNPPYVRQEKIKELKALKEIQAFKSYNGTADLYIYFLEKGFNLLKPNGVLSYITSNKYTRAKYGKDFRNFLLENTEILNYIDFHNVKVFKSATTDTSILSFKKSIGKHSNFIYCDIDNSYKKNTELENFINEKGFKYQQNDLQGNSFSFANPEELKIKKKIEKIGKPLKEWNVEINRGILTGFNEAFVIDGKIKEELIQQDAKSAEIIKPLLRGRDIKRYAYEFADKWLINLHNNPPLDIKNYPAIKKHLDKYYDKLAKRSDKGKTPYNLRNCAFLDEFEKEKIIWLELSDKNKFTIENKFYPLAGAFLMNGENLKYLLAFLNSKVIGWHFPFICNSSGVGTNQWKKVFVENLCIPKVSKEKQKPFEILVDEIMDIRKSVKDIESPLAKAKQIRKMQEAEKALDKMVYKLYWLNADEVAIIEQSISIK